MKIAAKTITIQDIRAPVQAELAATDQLILDELTSDIPLIQEITRHIIKSGGKRLRPLLVILFAKAAGYQTGIEHYELATIIEFVHTATLLHDDVVDKSDRRRGQQTANALWGNQASVLVGDFLYSRAFQILTRRSNVAIMHVLAKTTNAIAEGEVLQLMNCHDPSITEANYIDVITRKTAKLFESAAEIGAMLGSDDNTLAKAAHDYGLNIGLAFQIIDDLLDYTADAKTLGKNLGDDLAEGKATLPLIYTLKNSEPKTQQLIIETIQQGGLDHIDEIVPAIQQSGAIDYCQQRAKDYLHIAEKSLSVFAASRYKEALQLLIEFVLNRQY